MSNTSTGVSGFTILGGVIAGLLSFSKWSSVLLALIHGFLLGWVYVIYFAIRYGLHDLKF